MGQSANLEYVVEPDRAGWSIGFCGQHFGQFDRLQDAVDNALIDADHVGRLGHNIQVLVRRAKGEVREVWAYDHDLHRMTRRPSAVGDGAAR